MFHPYFTARKEQAEVSHQLITVQKRSDNHLTHLDLASVLKYNRLSHFFVSFYALQLPGAGSVLWSKAQGGGEGDDQRPLLHALV